MISALCDVELWEDAAAGETGESPADDSAPESAVLDDAAAVLRRVLRLGFEQQQAVELWKTAGAGASPQRPGSRGANHARVAPASPKASRGGDFDDFW